MNKKKRSRKKERKRHGKQNTITHKSNVTTNTIVTQIHEHTAASMCLHKTIFSIFVSIDDLQKVRMTRLRRNGEYDCRRWYLLSVRCGWCRIKITMKRTVQHRCDKSAACWYMSCEISCVYLAKETQTKENETEYLPRKILILWSRPALSFDLNIFLSFLVSFQLACVCDFFFLLNFLLYNDQLNASVEFDLYSVLECMGFCSALSHSMTED